MKRNWLITLLGVLLAGCAQTGKQEVAQQLPHKDVVQSLDIPDKTIDKSELSYQRQVSLWTLAGEPYSGYAVSYDEAGNLRQKFGVLNGMKQNEAADWYPDGHFQSLATYHQGKLHGEKKAWLPDSTHLLISHLQYHLGKLDGEQKKWYPSGEIFKILNMEMGKEVGMQRAFRKNGVVFANYEARNGRNFGLKRAALCYGLEEEGIQFAN